MRLPRLFLAAAFAAGVGHHLAFSEAAPKAGTLVSSERLTQLESQSSLSGDDHLELALAFDERKDAAKAAAHYRSAAEAGVGAAELRLGVLYEMGQGVTQSYPEAKTHYERAIGLGVAEANLRLGLLYLEGWGVPTSAEQAVAHIQKAAEASYVPAQKILADMYFAGVKVPRDLGKALVWAERSSAKDDPESLTRVGGIRAAAVKLPQDLQLAREWYQLSAEQDDTRGMLAMASTFLRPGADAANIEVGLRWLDLAAEGGNSAAAFYRAGAYLRFGPATSPDDERKATALLQQADAAGEAGATEVVQLVNSGWPAARAFAYVMTVPYDDRYVQRLATKPKPPLQDMTQPQPLKVVRPVYPEALRLTQTEGKVQVEFIVDTAGRVRDAHVVSASHPGFAEFAVAAVSSWRFAPGMKGGKPVNTRMQVPIQFQLSEVSEPFREANPSSDKPAA